MLLLPEVHSFTHHLYKHSFLHISVERTDVTHFVTLRPYICKMQAADANTLLASGIPGMTSFERDSLANGKQ